MLSVGKIVGGAFRLIKNNPAAVLVWGLCYGVASVGLIYAMRPLFQVQQTTLSGGDPKAAMSQMSSMMGTFILAELGIFVLFIVLFTAAQRAILRPEQGGFFYMRLGMDELKMFALAFVLLILFYIGLIVFTIVVAIVVGALAVTAGPGAMGLSLILSVGILLIAALWFEVRVSLMFPLTLMTGNIAIGEGWRLSRGHFWTLFFGYLVIGLIVIALWVVVAAVTMRPYFAALMRALDDPAAVQQAAQAQMEVYSSLANPMTIIGIALTSIVGALIIALFGGAFATAAKELTIDREGMAKTFA